MRLTASDAKKSFIRERNEEIKAKYMSAPSLQKAGKRTASFGDHKNTVISKIEIPSSIAKQSTGKSSASGDKGGVPQAKRADEIVDSTEVPSYSNATAKLPSPPTAKRTKTTMKSPQSNVKAKLATKGAKEKPAIPAAKDAKSYTDAMPHGSSTMSGRNNKSGEMSTPSSAKNKAPSNRPGKEKKKEATGLGELPGQKKTTAPSSPSKSMPAGDGAMETPSYSQQVKSSNLRENVQLILNGQPKSSFGFIHAKVLENIVRKYKAVDIDVKIAKSKNPPAWRNDKEFAKLVVESIDAKFSGAVNTEKEKKKKAFNRFLNLHEKDNNGFYESDRLFIGTALAAFKKLMEGVERRYRSKLEIFEGIARIEEKDGTPIDISLITQARNEKSALANLKNQIIEDFGFSAKIKHIILDGEKYSGNALRAGA